MTGAADDMMRFHLVYDGPALEEHRMDVRALAPALLAVGDLVERSNEILNGDQAKVSVNVHASFKTGSFGIDLDTAQSLWGRVQDLMSSHPVASISTLCTLLGLSAKDAVKGVVAVVLWIRGRTITKVEPLEDGIVRLYIDNDYLDTEERVIRLVQDYKVRKALEGMIYEPLDQDGIDSVSVMPRKGAEPVMHIERNEASYFRAPPPEDVLLDDDTYVANLQVVTVAFQDGNKWRFSEGGGGNAYFATVLDEGFIKRVQLNQENFAKDDIIRARVRRLQRITPQGLRADYEILEVLDHRSASPKVQFGIDFSGQDNQPPSENS
ncbi:hypothetical protein [Chromohalobacter israelensis]|uniref:hypothetical protein n=1 Tax=Chromohalobacter israelensis TaxID=141390 RepID=UPI00265B9DE2|nr:hypothetical protein [Chromohalobacter salexigens]MDO0944650.1 hypothetical protein [Chromohalobacter salexigens]